MKLKDVKINAEDLLNFINNNFSFEEPTVDSEGLRVEFFYKVRLSDFMDFVVKQAKIEKENNDDNVIVLGETKFGEVIQGEKKENEVTFRIKNSDLIESLDTVKIKNNIPRHRNPPNPPA
ncbi:hypothetical protein SAMN05421866_3496 [Chryseobacterium oranimense]|uniref:Uncharacterized protein n=1 Tax=Chryseobacterium oranimense TaxID=421058 RepID=A0A1M5V1A2_9FLAO|nr:hypothetical protein [Chryseobacterium oranimense]SHH69042.1 hypothetical protein SAMN05421866_3496 [Chryseobacterium oranimense]